VPTGLRRPRVIVTVPLSTLLGNPLAPGAVLGAGTPITGEAARRLACAEIVLAGYYTPGQAQAIIDYQLDRLFPDINREPGQVTPLTGSAARLLLQPGSWASFSAMRSWKLLRRRASSMSVTTRLSG
jgi:hypothetical protein